MFLLQHLLYILHDVCDHGLQDPSEGLKEIGDLLNIHWMQHLNGKCFGGINGQNYREELNVSNYIYNCLYEIHNYDV